MVIILRGVTGIGKSTVAEVLANKQSSRASQGGFLTEMHRKIYGSPERPNQRLVTIYSADSFFMVEGQYKFSPSKLSEAHSSCLRGALEAMRDTHDVDSVERIIIIDNTNTSIAEVAPYAAAALAYNHELKVITLIGDISTCIERHTHGAPEKNIIMQHENLRRSLVEWPHWWPQDVFFMK